MQGGNTRSRARAQESFKLDPADRATIEWVCKQSEQPQDRTVVRGKQIAHLRRIFAGRHGQRRPDTKQAREHLLALLRVMAAIPRIKAATLVKEVEHWAPWMTKSEKSELIDRARRTPRVHRKETLGRIIGLVDAEREKFKAWSIWPIDLQLTESKFRKQQRDRERQAQARRAAGCKLQSESQSQTKPWVADGISRTEWYRRRKARQAETEMAAPTPRDSFVAHTIDKDIYTGDEVVPNDLNPTIPHPSVIETVHGAPSSPDGLRRRFHPERRSV